MHINRQTKDSLAELFPSAFVSALKEGEENSETTTIVFTNNIVFFINKYYGCKRISEHQTINISKSDSKPHFTFLEWFLLYFHWQFLNLWRSWLIKLKALCKVLTFRTAKYPSRFLIHLMLLVKGSTHMLRCKIHDESNGSCFIRAICCESNRQVFANNSLL